MDTIHDPIHRASYAFRREGENLWVTTWLEDGGQLPEHFHPSLEERWEVLAGTARVKLDGAWRDVTPADGPVYVGRGVRHELRNTSGAVAQLQCEVMPAGDLEAFLVESARGAREGLYNRHGLPTSRRGAAWIAELALRHRHETVMCSPPPVVQRVMLPLLARIGARATPRTA